MSTDNIPRFPVSTSQRIKNRRGKRVLNCIVSDRYIRFDPPHRTALSDGYPIRLEVMLDRHPHTSDRKLCELIVTLEELQSVLAMLVDDLAAKA